MGITKQKMLSDFGMAIISEASNPNLTLRWLSSLDYPDK